MLAMLRSCGEALRPSAVDTMDQRRTTSWCTATSAIRSSAPIRRPSGVHWIPRNGRELMSTTRLGVSTSSFIRSTSVVPPAR